MTDNELSISGQQDRISVCICTYNRPEMLMEALEGVRSQVADGRFSLEVIVVDNDYRRSAEAVVKDFQTKTELRIVYDCEPEQNISLTRNRAIRNASGNFVAFLDDDEVPVGDWLVRLYSSIKEFGSDGALGPVVPFFPPGAPDWLRKGRVLDRPRLVTGMPLTLRDCRTGNVLVLRSAIDQGAVWFDPRFGRTGGEDVDFFKKQIALGRLFVWCDEAVAYEAVPPERWKASFHLRKLFRIGTVGGEGLRKGGVATITVLIKRIVSVPVWLITFLFAFPFGKQVWIKPAMKLAYSSGCILAYFGFSLMRYRDESR